MLHAGEEMESSDYISLDDKTPLKSMDCSSGFAPLPLSEGLKLFLPDSELSLDFYNVGEGESSCSNPLVSFGFDCVLGGSSGFPFDSVISVEDLEFLGRDVDLIMHENSPKYTHSLNAHDIQKSQNVASMDACDMHKPQNVDFMDAYDMHSPKDLNFVSSQHVVFDGSIKPVKKPSVMDEKTKNHKSLSSMEEKLPEIATVPIDMIHNKRPFKCMHLGCDKTFRNPQTLKMHHKTHYKQMNDSLVPRSSRSGHNKKIPCRCPVCSQTFVGLYELRRHFGRKHSKGEKMHDCKKCSKKFYIEVDLRDHEKICREPVKCKCGLKFAFKCTLSDHKRTHPECVEEIKKKPTSTKNASAAGLQSKSPSIGLMGMRLDDIWGRLGCRSRSSTVIRDASRKQ